MQANHAGKKFSHKQAKKNMARKKRDKDTEDKERFYLLAGQGGRAHRRKQRIFLTLSIIVGIVVSAMVAAILYLLNRSNAF